MTMYPSEWPKFDEPAIDRHITCGSAFCDEQKARDAEILDAAEAEMLGTWPPGTEFGPRLETPPAERGEEE